MSFTLGNQPKFVLPPLKPTSFVFMTDEQLWQEEQGNTFLFDVECFRNFFLIGFKSYQTGRVLFFELSQTEKINIAKLKWIVENFLLVGFNSDSYDLPLVWAAIAGKGNDELKAMSDSIIRNNFRLSKLEKEFVFKAGDCNHIDLIEVAPAGAQMLSLKHYGARMHVDCLQELPIDPDDCIETQQMLLYQYNHNDLLITGWLYSKLKAAIELRKSIGLEYELDLRSLSDAQLAEKVICREIQRVTGRMPKVPRLYKSYQFQFQNPSYIQFYTPDLQAVHRSICETIFSIDENGQIKISKNGELKSATNLWEVQIGKSKYKLGIGGIHSSEQRRSYCSNSNYNLFDRDVESYYPKIILNQNLFPDHIGPDFLQVYKDIVDRRLSAKLSGDKRTANSLKITINGTFGKLGSKWSALYSPNLLAQVTLTGQLSLLMLIEMLEWQRIQVVSANTDGIVIRCSVELQKTYLETVQAWEQITNFKTEETQYASIHSRDVNNYIAIGLDGLIKAKGAYANELSYKDQDRESLMKNPQASVIVKAVMLLLRDRQPIEKTINSCKDIKDFLFVRKVNGGAVKNNNYLGKTIRWYLREGEFGTIRYLRANKAKIKSIVSETTGACPLMDIREFPKDIDRRAYIQRANIILKDIGYLTDGLQQLDLFS